MDEIADEIEEIIKSSKTGDIGHPNDNKENPSYFDKKQFLQSNDQVKSEFVNALEIIRKARVYINRIDYFLANDDGEESFLERLTEELQKLK